MPAPPTGGYVLPAMKTEHIVRDLEEAVRHLGLEVRREKGNFRGGRCTVNGEDLVMLNKNHPAEVHLALLAESLRDLPVEAVFLRPAVREAMEAAWQHPVEHLRDALLEPDQADGE